MYDFAVISHHSFRAGLECTLGCSSGWTLLPLILALFGAVVCVSFHVFCALLLLKASLVRSSLLRFPHPFQILIHLRDANICSGLALVRSVY